jgi:hypothetical protein
MLGLLRGTTTQTGLEVTAEWCGRSYPTGVKVSAAEMKQLRIDYHATCPRWNYTIQPRTHHQWT